MFDDVDKGTQSENVISMNKVSVVDDLISAHSIISKMVTENQLRVVLQSLERVLRLGVDGEIVEMGCSFGTTSLFIRRLLDQYKSEKSFHVYDSFQGLPEKHANDYSASGPQVNKGSCKTGKKELITNFQQVNLMLPVIHTGWFSQIDDKAYPDKVAFAFLDGDFYMSITDSLSIIYPRMVTQGIIAIHDYQSAMLPGVYAACCDFFEHRPENGHIICDDLLGIIIKK